MRFVRFGTGIVVGLALGTAVPVTAQVWPYLLGTVLTARTYGVPNNTQVIFGCTDANGSLIQRSIARIESVPSSIAGVPFTLAAVTCS